MSPPRPAELEGTLKLAASGGEGEWRLCPPKKLYTNAFVWDPSAGKILLGYKKRGFGIHMYNGFGGKVEANESPLDAAKRELEEEASITAELELCGELLFTNDKQDFAHHIFYFRAHKYEGVPTESDEMRPEWFAIPKEYLEPSCTTQPSIPLMPLEKMWKDDEFWLPLLFAKRHFIGRADFREIPEGVGRDKYELERWWFGARED